MNVLRHQCLFFTTPNEFVDGGHLARLNGAAVKMYLVLFRLAQKHSAVELEIAGHEFYEQAGLHSETVIAGRRALEAAGLIATRKVERNVIAYRLLNPESKQPLPPPEGRKGVRHYRPTPGRFPPQRVNKTEPVNPLTWSEIGEAFTGGKSGVSDPLDSGKSGSSFRKVREVVPENPGVGRIEVSEHTGVRQPLVSLKESLREESLREKVLVSETFDYEQEERLAIEHEQLADEEATRLFTKSLRGNTPVC